MRCAVCRRRVHDRIVDVPGFVRAPRQRNTCRCATCWLFEVGRANAVEHARRERTPESGRAVELVRGAIRRHRRDREHPQTIVVLTPPPGAGAGIAAEGR